MKKKTVHIISHSHWDREWYLPLERHKMKLLDLIDTNMELFDKDPGFYSFHLDGQTIVLDDYLEIRPEKAFYRKRRADQPGDRRLVYPGQYLFLPCNLKAPEPQKRGCTGARIRASGCICSRKR